jgi:hypothetical protein
MKRLLPHFTVITALIILMLLLAGCGNNTTSTPPTTIPSTTATDTAVPPTITMTPDPCAPGNIQVDVDKVHEHMREFDDASILAANVSRDKVSDSIANLQRIRREAEDQPIPLCLTNLKTYQIAHMNTVINTLIAFMNNTDQNSINQGIALARQQHDQYTVELARVLGLKIVTATASAGDATPPSATP